jgi:hypothetical protein
MKEPRVSHTIKNTAVADAKAKGAKTNGRPKGIKRPEGSGMKKGQKTRPVLEREQSIAAALAEAFSELTDEQIETITPMEIMRLCSVSAVRAGNWGLALMAAEKWAPYVHPKLAAVVHHQGRGAGATYDEDGEPVDGQDAIPGERVRIIGGLPDLRPAKDAEIVPDKDGK